MGKQHFCCAIPNVYFQRQGGARVEVGINKPFLFPVVVVRGGGASLYIARASLDGKVGARAQDPKGTEHAGRMFGAEDPLLRPTPPFLGGKPDNPSPASFWPTAQLKVGAEDSGPARCRCRPGLT